MKEALTASWAIPGSTWRNTLAPESSPSDPPRAFRHCSKTEKGRAALQYRLLRRNIVELIDVRPQVSMRLLQIAASRALADFSRRQQQDGVPGSGVLQRSDVCSPHLRLWGHPQRGGDLLEVMSRHREKNSKGRADENSASRAEQRAVLQGLRESATRRAMKHTPKPRDRVGTSHPKRLNRQHSDCKVSSAGLPSRTRQRFRRGVVLACIADAAWTGCQEQHLGTRPGMTCKDFNIPPKLGCI